MVFRCLRERRERETEKQEGSKIAKEVVEKRIYYCDNPRHPHSEVVQVLTYEIDPRCPYCGKIMTYGKYWR